MSSRQVRLLRVSSRVAAMAALLALSWASVADASPTPAEKATARELVHLGNKYAAASNHEQALASYRAADAIMGVPTTALGVGRTLIVLGRLLEARAALEAIAEIPQADDESAPFREARVEAVALLAALNDKIPQLRVNVPHDARVWLNGTSWELTRGVASRALDPGVYRVRVDQSDGSSIMRTVSLVDGGREELVVAVKTAKASPPAAPAPKPPPAPIVVADETSFHVPLFLTGAVVAGLGLVVGTSTGVVSLDIASAVDARCDGTRCPADQRADAERATTLAHVSTASFVVAGAGAALALVALFVESPTTETGMVVTVGPGSLSFGGSF